MDNDETALLKLITDVLKLAVVSVSSVIISAAPPALRSIAQVTGLPSHRQVIYMPGRTVHHAFDSHRDDGKSDAKDPSIIADQTRMRRDLEPVHRGDDIAVDLHHAHCPPPRPGRQP